MNISRGELDSPELFGYSLQYEPELEGYEKVAVLSDTQEYTIENLSCGLSYDVFLSAYNSLDKSMISSVHVLLSRSIPVPPNAKDFIGEVGKGSAELNLSTWNDGGCPIHYFQIQLMKLITF